ncbi:hypothetical protein N7512_006359 [Penicillium capsulatum]|nr:hypothetical protein N7512_006359 [Penicillium capsulatum]
MAQRSEQRVAVATDNHKRQAVPGMRSENGNGIPLSLGHLPICMFTITRYRCTGMAFRNFPRFSDRGSRHSPAAIGAGRDRGRRSSTGRRPDPRVGLEKIGGTADLPQMDQTGTVGGTSTTQKRGEVDPRELRHGPVSYRWRLTRFTIRRLTGSQPRSVRVVERHGETL